MKRTSPIESMEFMTWGFPFICILECHSSWNPVCWVHVVKPHIMEIVAMQLQGVANIKK